MNITVYISKYNIAMLLTKAGVDPEKIKDLPDNTLECKIRACLVSFGHPNMWPNAQDFDTLRKIENMQTALDFRGIV